MKRSLAINISFFFSLLLTIMTQTSQIVEKAWNDFLKYYEKRVKKYVKEIKLPNNEEFLYKKARNEYFVCWDEYDLLMHLGRFIYKHLEKEKLDGLVKIGRTFSSKLKFKEGDLIEVEGETLNIIYHKKENAYEVSLWAPRLMGKAKKLDSLEEVKKRAKKDF